ncbi:conserved hypothetical protein, partial [Neospora caninum Liverpool]
REAPHALTADLLDAVRAASGSEVSGGMQLMGSKKKLQSKASLRSPPSRGSQLAEELHRSHARYENDLFSEILAKLKAKKERGAEDSQVYEHLPVSSPKRNELPGDSTESTRSDVLSGLASKALNVELVDTAIDPEWAFQQFSGKKIDAGARFDDRLDRLTETPEEVKLHGYFPFQKESAKSRYERLITEVPHALVAVKEYFSNVDMLEKIHKQEEQLPEESRAGFLLRLNGMLEDQGAALSRLVKNYVATDVPLQNILFGRTHFTPEGEPVDVDLFDAYCPDDCVAVDAVASSVLRDAMLNDEVVAANLERRVAAIESRLDEVSEMIDEDNLLPWEDLTAEALHRFKADSRDFATQLASVDRLLSRTLSEAVLSQLETRLQLVKRQLDEQEEFLRRRQQQRVREKQRQLDSGNAPVGYDDILEDWKPEKLLEKLHQSLKDFKDTAERVDTIGGQLEAAFAAREPLVGFLQQMRKQEKQNEVLKASLGSTVEMLKSLNATRTMATDSSAVSAVLGFSGVEVTGKAGGVKKKVSGLPATFARAHEASTLVRASGRMSKDGSREREQRSGLTHRASRDSSERRVRRTTSLDGTP